MLADQGACHRLKGFVDRCAELNGSFVSYIPKCAHAGKKAECWDRFDLGTAASGELKVVVE